MKIGFGVSLTRETWSYSSDIAKNSLVNASPCREIEGFSDIG
jgi:hypothetical protein